MFFSILFLVISKKTPIVEGVRLLKQSNSSSEQHIICLLNCRSIYPEMMVFPIYLHISTLRLYIWLYIHMYIPQGRPIRVDFFVSFRDACRKRTSNTQKKDMCISAFVYRGQSC